MSVGAGVGVGAGISRAFLIGDLPAGLETTISPFAQRIPDRDPAGGTMTVGEIPGMAAYRTAGNYTFNSLPADAIEIHVGGSARADGYEIAAGALIEAVVFQGAAEVGRLEIEDAVEVALTVADGPGNTLEILRNDIVTTGVYDIDLTVADPSINETVQLDVADLVAGAVMLAVPVPTGTAAVGAVLSAQEGIAATEDAGGITGRNYRWLRFLTASETLQDAVAISGATAATYTVQAADQGYTIVCEQTAVDAGGPGTAAISPPGVALPAAPSLTPVTFTAANGTLLSAYVPEDGEAFADVSPSPAGTPFIFNNKLLSGDNSNSQYWVQNGRAAAANVSASLLIGRIAGGGNESGGLLLMDVANDCRYVLRHNQASDELQLFRFGTDGTLPLWSGGADGVTGGSHVIGASEILCLADITGNVLTVSIDGNALDTGPFDISADSWVSGYAGIYLRQQGTSANTGVTLDGYTFGA